jgi:hypothetical protein
MYSKFLVGSVDREFQTKTDRLTEVYFSEVRRYGMAGAMRRHRSRWHELRCWYSQHPAADRHDKRYVALHG